MRLRTHQKKLTSNKDEEKTSSEAQSDYVAAKNNYLYPKMPIYLTFLSNTNELIGDLYDYYQRNFHNKNCLRS